MDNCEITKGPVDANCDIDVDIPDITDPGLAKPTVGTVTEEKLDGNGVFDIYMRAGTNHLNLQYEEGRIKGSDYAQAYLGMMELMMVEANKMVLGIFKAQQEALLFPALYEKARYDLATARTTAQKMEAEKDLVCQQAAELKVNGESDRELKCAQTRAQEKTVELYDRQIEGFDDKFQTDVYKIMMDAWAAQGAEISSNPADSVLGTLKAVGLETVQTSFPATDSIIDKMLKKSGIN